MENPPIFHGKTHYFDWAIFNSYVSHNQRVTHSPLYPPKWWTSMGTSGSSRLALPGETTALVAGIYSGHVFFSTGTKLLSTIFQKSFVKRQMVVFHVFFGKWLFFQKCGQSPPKYSLIRRKNQLRSLILTPDFRVLRSFPLWSMGTSGEYYGR